MTERDDRKVPVPLFYFKEPIHRIHDAFYGVDNEEPAMDSSGDELDLRSIRPVKAR